MNNKRLECLAWLVSWESSVSGTEKTHTQSEIFVTSVRWENSEEKESREPQSFKYK